MAWETSTSSGFPAPTRALILQRDPTCRCPSCPRCSETGCTRASTEADHIVAKANGGNDHPTNGQGLCTQCHRHKSLSEATEGRRRAPRERVPEAHPGRLRPPGGGPPGPPAPGRWA